MYEKEMTPTDSLQEQIEEILELESSVLRINNKVRPRLIKELASLITKARKGAVEDILYELIQNVRKVDLFSTRTHSDARAITIRNRCSRVIAEAFNNLKTLKESK